MNRKTLNAKAILKEVKEEVTEEEKATYKAYMRDALERIAQIKQSIRRREGRIEDIEKHMAENAKNWDNGHKIVKFDNNGPLRVFFSK